MSKIKRDSQFIWVVLFLTFLLIYYKLVNSGMVISHIQIAENVVPDCVVRSPPANVNFGSLQMGYWRTTDTITSSSNFSVSCTRGTYASFAINEGEHAHNHHREMFNGVSQYLKYEVYTSSNQSKIWNEQNVVFYKSEELVPSTFTMYAYLSPGQHVVSGTYNDHLIVSMKIYPSEAVKTFPVTVSINYLPKSGLAF